MGKELRPRSSELQISCLWRVGAYNVNLLANAAHNVDSCPLIQRSSTLSRKMKLGNANGKPWQGCRIQTFKGRKSGHRKTGNCLNNSSLCCILPSQPVIWRTRWKWIYTTHKIHNQMMSIYRNSSWTTKQVELTHDDFCPNIWNVI